MLVGRDRRSDRRADDVDVPQPDNPHGRRVVRLRGRNLGHVRDLSHGQRTDGQACKPPDWWLIWQSHVHPHGLGVDGANGHRADNPHDHRGVRRYAHNLRRVGVCVRHVGDDYSSLSFSFQGVRISDRLLPRDAGYCLADGVHVHQPDGKKYV